MCIEAQHRRVFEGAHGRGTFPCKARVPPKFLRLECEKKKVWDPAKGAFTEDVLKVIAAGRGLPTTKRTKGVTLHIDSWLTYTTNDPGFTQEAAASLIYTRGPVIGVLWADAAYDDYVGKSVYRGFPKSERGALTSTTTRGLHAVVCYKYRHQGRELQIKIIDNYVEDGPRRWIAFDAFEYFVLPEVNKPLELVR